MRVSVEIHTVPVRRTEEQEHPSQDLAEDRAEPQSRGYEVQTMEERTLQEEEEEEEVQEKSYVMQKAVVKESILTDEEKEDSEVNVTALTPKRKKIVEVAMSAEEESDEEVEEDSVGTLVDSDVKSEENYTVAVALFLSWRCKHQLLGFAPAL